MSTFVYEMNRFAPIVVREKTKNEPGEVVGIISARHRVAWVCSPHRDDRRTGAVTRRPMSEYWKAMGELVSISE